MTTVNQTKDTSTGQPSGERMLRMPEVRRRCGDVCPATIYNAIAEGKFPRPRRIFGRSVGWPESEIDEFIRTREHAGIEDA